MGDGPGGGLGAGIGGGAGGGIGHGGRGIGAGGLQRDQRNLLLLPGAVQQIGGSNEPVIVGVLYLGDGIFRRQPVQLVGHGHVRIPDGGGEGQSDHPLLQGEVGEIAHRDSADGEIAVQGGKAVVQLGDGGRVEIGKAEIQHGLCVGVVGLMAVQHHRHQGHVISGGEGHKGVAGQGCISGLSAEGALVVLGAAGQEHGVMGVDRGSLRIVPGGGQVVVPGAVDLQEHGVLDGRPADQGHVVGGGVVVLVV